MCEYRISRVDNSLKLRQFIKLPFELYDSNDNWVPPLYLMENEFYNSKTNKFYNHANVKLFLCYKNNKPVGRISANINFNYNKFQNENVGFWGSFETINDSEVVKLLFEKVYEFFTENKIKVIRGPFTFSTNEISGLLVNDFSEKPMFMMPYNKKYYEKLILEEGHFKVKDLWAYYMTDEIYKKVLDVDLNKIIDKYKLEVRKINFKNFEQEIKLLSSIYNDAWQKNWGFVPMTYDEFYQMGKELKMFVPEESVLIAYTDGMPAGFLIAVPDFNFVLDKIGDGKLFPFGWLKALYYKNKVKRGRVITLGLSQKFRRRGLDIFLIKEAIKFNGKRYCDGCELSWILEDNYMMNKILKKFGNEHYRTYRVFEKNI